MVDPDLLNLKLIEICVKTDSREGVLKRLARLLIDNGFVKESYLPAILEREKQFPTGLPTEGVGVAIPHADTEDVIKPGISIATLKEPVIFNVMGSPDEQVDVSIIFMLALSDPNMQLELLQNLVQVLQNKELLLSLTKVKDKSDFINLLKKHMKIGCSEGI